MGRLCCFNGCLKGRRDCMVPGCGAVPFNKHIEGPRRAPLFWRRHATRCHTGEAPGDWRFALDLPVVTVDCPPDAARRKAVERR